MVLREDHSGKETVVDESASWNSFPTRKDSKNFIFSAAYALLRSDNFEFQRNFRGAIMSIATIDRRVGGRA